MVIEAHVIKALSSLDVNWVRGMMLNIGRSILARHFLTSALFCSFFSFLLNLQHITICPSSKASGSLSVQCCCHGAAQQLSKDCKGDSLKALSMNCGNDKNDVLKQNVEYSTMPHTLKTHRMMIRSFQGSFLDQLEALGRVFRKSRLGRVRDLFPLLCSALHNTSFLLIQEQGGAMSWAVDFL